MTSSIATTSCLLRLVMLLFCRLVVLSSCRRSFSSFVNLRSVRVMLQLCLGYVRSIRVMSGSVEVCQGLQGSIQVCQPPPSGSVKVHQGFQGLSMSVMVCQGLSWSGQGHARVLLKLCSFSRRLWGWNRVFSLVFLPDWWEIQKSVVDKIFSYTPCI